MDWLIQLGIMEESNNSIGTKVYGIVDMIRLHICYEEDNGIELQLAQLLLEGKAAIAARKIKNNTSRGKRKQVTTKRRETKLSTKTQIIRTVQTEDNSRITEF